MHNIQNDMRSYPDALFHLIFDSINDGVFTVDENFRITSFNAAAERITGIPHRNAIGRKCYDVLKASICQRGCALRKTLDSGRPMRDVRVDILNSRMDPVPIAVSTAVLKDRNGQMMGGVEIFRDLSDVERLRNQLRNKRTFRDIIGASSVMQEIFSLIPKIAGSESSILIRGPSGTGKEIVAHAIHDLSPRRKKAFIRVNCGALPDTLLESELFGYFKGAFTGALKDKPGLFQQADGGTLFLDEVGDVSAAFQVKLLRALEEGEIQAVGGTSTSKVDVRLITATNQDLEDLVSRGLFRDDLYYRINVIPLDLPPLRDRREDIPLLITHFLRILSDNAGSRQPELTPDAMRILYDYDYPGNIRELRNILERAFVLCPGNTIDVHHFPSEVTAPVSVSKSAHGIINDSAAAGSNPRTDTGTENEYSKDDLDYDTLVRTLNSNGWRRSHTAEALGISRTTLWRRMKEMNLL